MDTLKLSSKTPSPRLSPIKSTPPGNSHRLRSGALPRLRRPVPFRDCRGYSRWEQQLDGCRGSRAALRRVENPGQGGGRKRAPLRRVRFSAPKLDSCSVRWRSGFPRGNGGRQCFPDALWVHDGFQMLSELSDAPTLTTRCRCRAATDHRINIAAHHLDW